MSDRVSAREAEVLELLGEHLTNAEIAARLFISVRTVESHVSSLLRKLELPGRRALAQHATDLALAAPSLSSAPLPAPLTSFVGRGRELRELGEAIAAHRQVTAVGPGGVGKTRLAQAVAAEVAGGFADGVWFVDLVPVEDPERVGAAVAAAVGVGEQIGGRPDEAVLAALADREALLVLDNCERVRGGVGPFVERLLAGCPRLRVLATSRARLLVPFERVYPVPPLSLAGGGESEAVALFVDRAAAVGWPPGPPAREEVVAICERLDGMALSIELAAVRWAALGLDGLAAGLDDQLGVLTGGARADDRHGSVRAVLDWSHELLEPAARAVLRRVSVFVAPFTAEAAAEVTGFAPLEPASVADTLARLVEQSLLTVTMTAAGTRYRALEPIRQYGDERLAGAGETAEVRTRHLAWCRAVASELAGSEGPGWRSSFDAAADDLRDAVRWAADHPGLRSEARHLASCLGDLAFTRTLLGEAQERHEQAAALADDPSAAISSLRRAAAVAGCRRDGDGMFRLHLAAGNAARQVGDRAGAAVDLATAANAVYRFSGSFAQLPSRDDAVGLLDAARELAGDDPAALAAVAVAEAGVLAEVFGGVQTNPVNDAAHSVASAQRAVDLAGRAGDPLAESAALDALTAAQAWAGDSFGSAATSRRRMEVLASTAVTPASTRELLDALVNAAETGVGVGDLRGAHRWAGQLAEHPLLAEAGHQAVADLLVVDALVGDTTAVLAGGVRFLDGWHRDGRKPLGGLAPAASAVAMAHGLRGDEAARLEWLAIVDRLEGSPGRPSGYAPVLDAVVHLHRGDPDAALARLAPEPQEVWKWVTWMWLHWYVALRAEAAALAGHPDGQERVVAARRVVAGNPVATALVDRAEALLREDRPALLAASAALEASGCRYQSARTLVLAGGDRARAGGAVLTDLGIAPPPTRR